MKNKILVSCFVLGLVFCFNATNVVAISSTQKNVIVNNCDKIKDSLKNIQKSDAKARVFLGSHYETVLSKYMTSLNVRLVENNISKPALIDNQNELAKTKDSFSTLFVDYQKDLEELVAMDCRVEPEKFYERIVTIRTKRKNVASNVSKMREITLKNIKLVKELKESL
ncbi:hypothetical protein IJH15_03515 [Candidatus Saccharibacteria bacterium]|nr:hypothetical protein [Candidatus Saccharibacteria bacterium]